MSVAPTELYALQPSNCSIFRKRYFFERPFCDCGATHGSGPKIFSGPFPGKLLKLGGVVQTLLVLYSFAVCLDALSAKVKLLCEFSCAASSTEKLKHLELAVRQALQPETRRG